MVDKQAPKLAATKAIRISRTQQRVFTIGYPYPGKINQRRYPQKMAAPRHLLIASEWASWELDSEFNSLCAFDADDRISMNAARGINYPCRMAAILPLGAGPKVRQGGNVYVARMFLNRHTFT